MCILRDTQVPFMRVGCMTDWHETLQITFVCLPQFSPTATLSEETNPDPESLHCISMQMKRRTIKITIVNKFVIIKQHIFHKELILGQIKSTLPWLFLFFVLRNYFSVSKNYTRWNIHFIKKTSSFQWLERKYDDIFRHEDNNNNNITVVMVIIILDWQILLPF